MDIAFPLDYEEDVDRTVFEDELGPWLPDSVFDFHSHIYSRDCVSGGPKENPDPSLPTVCEYYPVENYLDSMARLFPGKKLEALVFNTVLADSKMCDQNAYVARALQEHDNLHGLMMCGVSEDEEALEEELRSGRFLGTKPYWTYVTWKAQADVTLEDMIPPGQRRLAERLGLIQMVHIPRLGRLADPMNVDGLLRLCEDCPSSPIIMAHFGRAYFPEAVGDLRSLPDCPNLYVDFSMVQSWEACEIMINAFGPDKILFGLDMPVAQEKGKLVSANGQRHFFTKRIHPWSIHNSTGSYRIRCTFYAYEIVRAFKKAAERVGLGQEDVRKVFWANAKALVARTEARLGY